ncbi:hypothetical protein V5O48_013493 [Marasmius crinis-equi]|uniref:Transposase n=1 Tax=Marasmius crinis-equi TaxID=585013 RepID=A0ABR3EZY2_9AGAR
MDDIPNFKTFEGFLGFLSAYNIILLESLIWPERYLGEPSQDRVVELYEEVKASVEELMAFPDDKMHIDLTVMVGEEIHNRDGDSPNASGKTRKYDIRNRYFVHQL